jgi:hypothetical protein
MLTFGNPLWSRADPAELDHNTRLTRLCVSMRPHVRELRKKGPHRWSGAKVFLFSLKSANATARLAKDRSRIISTAI